MGSRVLKTWRANRAGVVAAEERIYSETEMVIPIKDWYLIRQRARPWITILYLQAFLHLTVLLMCLNRSKEKVRMTHSAHIARRIRTSCAWYGASSAPLRRQYGSFHVNGLLTSCPAASSLCKPVVGKCAQHKRKTPLAIKTIACPPITIRTAPHAIRR